MRAVWKAALAALGLVVLGFALGVGADHMWLAHRLHSTGPQELTHEESFFAMLDTLNLTTEQRTAIDEIFERRHASVQRHLDAVHAQLLPMLDSARLEMEAVLNGEQLQVFHAWMNIEHERLDSVGPAIIRH